MDPTDILVESLIKAVSTEAVKRGLDAISTRLRSVFERGSRDEIKKIIEEDDLASPLSILAKESLDSSYIIPFSTPNEARPSHKVDFFFYVLQYFFMLSLENKMDILVPGSFADAEHLSLFATSGRNPPLKKEGLQISISTDISDGRYMIIPAGADALRIFEQYKIAVAKVRNENENYVQCGKLTTEDNFRYTVERLSAGTAYFKFPSIALPDFPVGTGKSGGGISLTSWSDGIRSMLEHAGDFPGINILPVEEVVRLIALADEFRERTRKAAGT